MELYFNRSLFWTSGREAPRKAETCAELYDVMGRAREAMPAQCFSIRICLHPPFRSVLSKNCGRTMARSTLRRLHLWRHYKETGPSLRAAFEEVTESDVAAPATVTRPEHYSPRIPGLAVQHGFHCQLPDCNHEKEALSIHRTEKDCMGRLIAAVEDEEDPLYRVQSAPGS
jgi:hypothetical protein